MSSLRLHDCPGDDAADEESIGNDWLEDRGRSRRRERERMAARVVDDEFEEALERTRSPDPAAAVTALARYERELEAALERDDGGESYRAVFWTYYEPVVESIDAVAREDGWPFLLEVAEAYDHREDGTLSDATAVVANVVARSVIRARLTEGVDAIPVAALTYLGSIPTFDDGSFEIAWEESQHVGWAIGHPEYSLEETVLEAVEDDDIWAGAATFRALHTDQEAAAPLYAEVIRRADDVGFVLDRLAHLEGIPNWSVFPRGWDVDAEFDRHFTLSLEESTENQLREAITEIGYDERLPEDWTLEDLELRW
ncbi:hypothetical protein [Natrialbaceae archaeon AArc-T1-2]|uniref:hypothetical protein n=1 Tax=Natrialbaceae archaeon AArc-T1-2 TaxID=3053904 RepID=UPI00255AB456|nr:hypothetical protein [Natrialbaceae archaeon AArc-T1-2]WIV66382.1 hypothetical protein QQ977_11870 [Natrialbaceae archaeon AArc-T1-2]